MIFTKRPALSTAELLRRKGKPLGAVYGDTLAIVIRESVLEEILHYSETDMEREIGGFLLGQTDEDEELCVEIKHFLPASQTESHTASLTFTHDTWSAMSREVEARFPDQSVVGWHHTHPGLGVFLSGYDLFIHRNFFSAPWQMALVVDPQQKEFGFYQWRKGRITDCGFICTTEK